MLRWSLTQDVYLGSTGDLPPWEGGEGRGRAEGQVGRDAHAATQELCARWLCRLSHVGPRWPGLWTPAVVSHWIGTARHSRNRLHAQRPRVSSALAPEDSVRAAVL